MQFTARPALFYSSIYYYMLYAAIHHFYHQVAALHFDDMHHCYSILLLFSTTSLQHVTADALRLYYALRFYIVYSPLTTVIITVPCTLVALVISK